VARKETKIDFCVAMRYYYCMSKRNPNTVCSVCDAPLYRRPSDLRRTSRSYCENCLPSRKSNAQETRRINYISRWKQGLENGMRGKTAISNHIRQYLFEKYDRGCCRCGWGEVNEYTGKIPLEIEHIDGNFRNNTEENLLLLCPNCHSLTPTYKSLNWGNGRPR
jgi:hypothetical protein